MSLLRRLKRAWRLRRGPALPQALLAVALPVVIDPPLTNRAARQRAEFMAAAYPLACMARGAVITFTQADHESRIVTRLATEMRITFEKAFVEFLDAPSMENLQNLRVVWTDFLNRIDKHVK